MVLKNLFSRILNVGEIQRQSIVSLIWQIGQTFIGFLSTVYFAQTLGASVLGSYFLFIAYLSVINLMADGGFGDAAIKRISEGEEQNAYFSAFVLLRSIFVVLVVIVLITFQRYFVDLNDSGTFIWLILSLIVGIFYGAVSSGILGCAKVGIAATATFINNTSRIIVQVIAVVLGYGVAGLAGGFVAGMIICSMVQLRFFDLRFVRFRWTHIKSLATFSVWIFLISSGMIVFSTADTIMIGYFLNDANVGVYRIVLQFTLMATFMTVVLRSTLYPRVSRWGKIGNITLIEKSLSRAFTYSLILAIPMSVGGILLGDKLLYYFYGPDFADGYITMVVLFIVQIINIFHHFFTTYLTAMDHLKDLFKITILSVAANIALNILLIPMMGILGAAIATLFTMGLNAFLAMGILSKILNIAVEIDSLLNILKASVMMGSLIMVYRMLIPLSNIWLTLVPVMIGGMLYLVLLLTFDKGIYKDLKGVIAQMSM
ncbi:flippase [Methanomethylovorans sp.]|uniref:flippase n=1 Tax=Methanomethylovorans sp. TaxID=2758717 RepID=UPI001BD24647|nr:flippase [Methanomethylovorans sp.]